MAIRLVTSSPLQDAEEHRKNKKMLYVKAYAAALALFLLLDFIWLGFVARDFYASQLGSLLRDRIGYAAAGGFYLAYVVGIVVFAIVPALNSGSWARAALSGALFGLLAYGTYDMTNIATLKDWPITMSIVDMAWGTFLTATVATAGFFAAQLFS